jgi:hypothetical protein
MHTSQWAIWLVELPNQRNHQRKSENIFPTKQQLARGERASESKEAPSALPSGDITHDGQSINQSTNQPINQSIKRTNELCRETLQRRYLGVTCMAQHHTNTYIAEKMPFKIEKQGGGGGGGVLDVRGYIDRTPTTAEFNAHLATREMSGAYTA